MGEVALLLDQLTSMVAGSVGIWEPRLGQGVANSHQQTPFAPPLPPPTFYDSFPLLQETDLRISPVHANLPIPPPHQLLPVNHLNQFPTDFTPKSPFSQILNQICRRGRVDVSVKLPQFDQPVLLSVCLELQPTWNDSGGGCSGPVAVYSTPLPSNNVTKGLSKSSFSDLLSIEEFEEDLLAPDHKIGQEPQEPEPEESQKCVSPPRPVFASPSGHHAFTHFNELLHVCGTQILPYVEGVSSEYVRQTEDPDEIQVVPDSQNVDMGGDVVVFENEAQGETMRGLSDLKADVEECLDQVRDLPKNDGLRSERLYPFNELITCEKIAQRAVEDVFSDCNWIVGKGAGGELEGGGRDENLEPEALKIRSEEEDDQVVPSDIRASTGLTFQSQMYHFAHDHCCSVQNLKRGGLLRENCANYGLDPGSASILNARLLRPGLRRVGLSRNQKLKRLHPKK